MDLSLVPYEPHDDDHDQQQHHHRHNHHNKIKYKECMRNHAASLGRHAKDGCGEFMPTPSLTCAACGCHRNFHRQELPGNPTTHHRYPHHLLVQPPPLLLYHHPSHHPHGYDDHDRRSETPEREEVNLNVGPAKGKRCRTKFTQEQKERMLEFAERIGWRIQRHQEVALNRFCNEVGIKRNVMKVWMHNNKNAHRRRESASHSPVVTPTPPPRQPVVGV